MNKIKEVYWLKIERVNIKHLNCTQSVINTIANYYSVPYFMMFYKSYGFAFNQENVCKNKSPFFIADNDENIMFSKIKLYHGIGFEQIEFKNKIEVIKDLIKKEELILVKIKTKYVDWCNDISGEREHLFLIVDICDEKIKIMDPYYLTDFGYCDFQLLDKAISINRIIIERKEQSYSLKDFIISNVDFFNESESVIALQKFLDNSTLLLEKQCYEFGANVIKSPLIKNLNAICDHCFNLVSIIDSTQLVRDSNCASCERFIELLNYQLKKWEALRLLIMKNCICGNHDNKKIFNCLNDLLVSSVGISKIKE